MKQMNMTDKIYEAGHFAPKLFEELSSPFEKKKIVKMNVVNNTLYFIHVVKRNCMNIFTNGFV